jgi:hypothetical protein
MKLGAIAFFTFIPGCLVTRLKGNYYSKTPCYELFNLMRYHDVLAQVEPDRVLYLAVSEEVTSGLFEEPIGELLLRNNRVRLLVFDPEAEAIVKWIP